MSKVDAMFNQNSNKLEKKKLMKELHVNRVHISSHTLQDNRETPQKAEIHTEFIHLGNNASFIKKRY